MCLPSQLHDCNLAVPSQGSLLDHKCRPRNVARPVPPPAKNRNETLPLRRFYANVSAIPDRTRPDQKAQDASQRGIGSLCQHAPAAAAAGRCNCCSSGASRCTVSYTHVVKPSTSRSVRVSVCNVSCHSRAAARLADSPRDECAASRQHIRLHRCCCAVCHNTAVATPLCVSLGHVAAAHFRYAETAVMPCQPPPEPPPSNICHSRTAIVRSGY